MNHEPEDLPGELTEVPSWPGELARMSCGCNPQGLCKALGIFYLGSGVLRTSRCVGFLLGAVVLLAMWSAPAAPDDEMSNMKRRQQGILTGMPFMANITPRTFVDALGASSPVPPSWLSRVGATTVKRPAIHSTCRRKVSGVVKELPAR